jgi:hypothetical protein
MLQGDYILTVYLSHSLHAIASTGHWFTDLLHDGLRWATLTGCGKKLERFELCFAHVRPGVVKITAKDIEDGLTWTTEYGIYVVKGRGRMREVRRLSPLVFCTKVLMVFLPF